MKRGGGGDDARERPPGQARPFRADGLEMGRESPGR
jgi:hypothetical protein